MSMMKHNRWLQVWVLVTWTLAPARAEFDFDANVPLSPEIEQAVVRAQDWLVARQNPNGSWDANNGKNSLATMALMVNGNTPGKGRCGAEIARAVEFMISSQTPRGFLGIGGQGPMYQHALATLALAEVYGMTQNPAIRDALIKAIDLIVETQDYGGGWRYEPRRMQGDLSVTVMQVMALRAGAESGIYVPQETIDLAIKFIRSCWNEAERGFGYTGVGPINFNRAAAGIVCLQSVGLYDDPMVPKAVETVTRLAFEPGDRAYYWYGHYYASVALYHYGGDAWKDYYPRICKKVQDDWTREGHYGDVLDTAWAILVIGVPYRYLPIYQR